MAPIHLNLMWHQHQPYYRDRLSRHMALPWVRLHAIKDYYDMAAILRDFPKVHQTINLVPALLLQLEGYLHEGFTDYYLEPCEKPVEELSEREVRFLLEHFFDASPRMMESMPRWRELREQRGKGPVTPELVARFSRQDLLDLEVCFNLAWIDPLWRETDGDFCQTLWRIGHTFTEKQKNRLLLRQREIMAQVIPVHRELADAGQIEITTSPYFHPILPLLIDSAAARQAMPDCELPDPPYARPEDAEAQVRLGLEAHERWFGRRPRGLWPSEGSVSPELIPILARQGVEWIATDEEILARSLDVRLSRDADEVLQQPEVLYQPYLLPTQEGNVAVVFRDRVLSDRIGFHYANMEAEHAVGDFMRRLETIARQMKNKKEPPLVSVILDGENCWEWYADDGRPFLLRLYERLSESRDIRCVTVSEHLDMCPPKKKIKKIFAGSWIDHNFYIWIGHADDRRAWAMLARAREALEAAEKAGEIDADSLEIARHELYAAEGSDWCWWYGDDHNSPHDAYFDRLFRSHVREVYENLGLIPPADVHEPIGLLAGPLAAEPVRMISPSVNGRADDPYEWEGAGYFDARAASGAMHHASEIVRRIDYGCDTRCLYVRVSMRRPLEECLSEGYYFELHASRPVALVAVADTSHRPPNYSVVRAEDRSRVLHFGDALAVGEVLEWGVPWEAFQVGPGDTLEWTLHVLQNGTPISAYPAEEAFRLTRPQ